MGRAAVHGVELVRAGNPGPFTLSGTNTWLVGRDPCWIVDPGPALPEHVDAVEAEARRRGGAGGIAVTHDHHDHVEGLQALRARLGDPPVGGRRGADDVVLTDGAGFGPLTAVATPGHADDHLAFTAAGGRVAFTGDAVLGEGSVFLMPGAGGLDAYLEALRRLDTLPLELICPGHGPVVEDPHGRLRDHVGHRLDRERALVAALDAGARTVDELLDA